MLLIRYKNRQEKLFKALEIENENNVVCWHPMRGIIDNNIVNDELKNICDHVMTTHGLRHTRVSPD